MVTAILLPCLVWQPALAAGAVVAGGQERITVVGKAANGVERIDIAAPNSKGLSHNLYQDFNVDKQGVILNNATSLSKTELGGYVQANPHLSRGAASLILNEVTSRNPSVLGGYMEVAGKKAGVVVANPNGITCDGCGFINTSRGTFTTGKPQLDANGALWGFDVQNGLITFDGQGFNAKGLDQFDVVSRVIKINAELYADRLNLITGKQQVDYATLATHVGEPATDAPAVAIDSSELGGIYANRINLVSTEQGVGVSLNAPVAALTGDVSLSADGKIRYDQMSAAGNITVNGTDLEGSKDVLAGGALNITGDSLTQSAGTLGGNNVSLSVSHDISLTSDTKVAAKRGLVVSASTISGYADAVLSARDLSLSVGNDLSFDHEIDWQGNVKLTTLGVINVDGQGALIAQGGLNLEAAAIVNDGDLVSLDGGMSLTSAGDIRNTGLIYAAQDVHVKLPGTFTNGDETTADIRPAAVYVGGDLSISDGKGGRAVAINNNASLIQSQGDMELKADEINNNRLGIVISDPQTSKTTKTVQTGRNHRQTAVTTTTSYTFIERGTPGQILSGANADVEADAINNNQSILSASEVMTVNGSYAGNSRDLISNTHVVTTYMYRDRPKGSNHHHWYTDSVVPEDLTPVLTDSIGSVLGASILHMTGNVENGAPVALVPSYKPPSSGGAALNLDNLLNNALSKVNREPGYPYFIESRYQFANLNGFKGSEYMLGQLGWTPDDTTKLLGDAFTELSLARQELNALGLPEVAALDNEQLMRQYADWVNAGLYASNELQLAPGISLTADQVNALTQDIIWPVEKTIAGVRVMVPTLFLARTSADLNRSGSIIAADVIDINGDNITNGGQMRATGDITLHGSDINLAGSVTAGGDIDANATHDLNLSSAQVAGQDVTLHGDHNVTLETAATTHVYDNYGNTVTRTDVGQQASVNASGKLVISAGNPDDSTPDDGGDLVINGVKLSGNQVSLDATHDIGLGVVQDVSGHDVGGKRTHDTEVHVNNIVTDITSTLDTLMQADNDITLLGSDVNAGGDLQLAAKGDVTVSNVTDSDYHYRQETDSKWYGSKTTTTTDYDEKVVGPKLGAGGDLLINTHKDADGKIVTNDDAKGNVTLVSANVHSGGDTAVYAGGDLTVGVATETHEHKRDVSHSYSGVVKGLATAVGTVATLTANALSPGSGKFVNVKLDGSVADSTKRGTVVAGKLDAGGNTVLLAGHDINLTATQLDTSNLYGTAGLGSEGGSIYLKGAKDTVHTEHSHTSYNVGGGMDGGSVTFASHDKNSRTTDDDTWQGVTLTSRNDIHLNSTDDLIATGASFKSGGKTTLDATNGQVALLAGEEDHSSTRSIDQDGNAGAFATNKRTHSDKLAKVTQVDAGGGLSITSKGDQTYEGTHITSGGPTELTSTEGGIHFALATDDHSSTHDKSSSNSNWVSSDTKGDITQTLHGVEIESATPVIVNAAKDVQVDIAHLDNADVNQMIDAMVQADPKLAWMKDMADRGDVNVEQVKAVAEHWHEHHQGAGQGLSLAVAVVATVMTGGAGAGVAATMMSAGESAIASQAVLTTMANNGHLDDTVKDITSKDSLQNLAVTMASAGVTQGVVDKYLGGTTNQYQITHGFDLNDTSLKSLENMQGAYGFVLHGAAQGLADAALDTAIKGGSFNDYLKTNMEQQGNNVLSALAFNEAGNLGIEGMTNSKTHVGFNAWADGGVAHVLTHAAVGAVVGKIVDGNATAGAAAAAFNEALTPGLESSLGEGKWHAAGVQFAGGYAAMLAGGSANTGSTIAKQADGYNRQLHKEEMRALTGAVDGYADLIGTDDRNKAIDQLLLQANRTVDAGYNASIKNNPVAEAYLNVVNAQYASTHDGKQLFHTTPLSYADATAGADHLYEIENIPSLGDGQPNRIRTAMLNGVTSGQASSDAAKETMNVMDWEGDQKSAELGGQAAGVLGLAVTLPVGGMAAKGLYDGGAAVVTEAIEFAKNPLLYYLANPGTVAGVTEAGIFTVAGVPQANSLLPEISFTQQAKQLEQEVAGGLRSVTMPSGSLVSNKVDNISTTELEGVLGQRYEGVKEASQFLQDAGVSREVRKQVLESFDIKTLNLRQATDGEFGIRYFDNVNASEKGRYLFEAFPASRQSLALKPEWNQMTYMKQFQIRPNTTILEGRASSMGVGIEGGQIQKYVLDMNDLLEPK